MNLQKLSSIILAALVAAVAATAALAAPDAQKPLTGTWSGKTHQDIAPLGEGGDFVEWKQRIVAVAINGRLTSLNVNVRYTCPNPTDPRAGDIRLNLAWSVLKKNGPLLTKHGSFALVVTHVTDPYTGREFRLPIPVSISGLLGPTGASGHFDLSKGDCSGKGNWQARRVY